MLTEEESKIRDLLEKMQEEFLEELNSAIKLRDKYFHVLGLYPVIDDIHAVLKKVSFPQDNADDKMVYSGAVWAANGMRDKLRGFEVEVVLLGECDDRDSRGIKTKTRKTLEQQEKVRKEGEEILSALKNMIKGYNLKEEKIETSSENDQEGEINS